MSKMYSAFFLMVLLQSCDFLEKKGSVNAIPQKEIVSADPDPISSTISEPFLQSDTFQNRGKSYVLQVFQIEKEQHSDCWFLVKQKRAQDSFKVILKDPDYGTNNSALSVRDQNGDGYFDIVWNKKWQDHAYLFNPKTETFVEVGECHTLDTLRVNDQIVYYKGLYPFLYYSNAEKESFSLDDATNTPWMQDHHSELFVLDSNYQKISFATLDNATTHHDRYRKQCESQKKIFVHCYVPPYKGMFWAKSIWNLGTSVDSFFLKNTGFDAAFVAQYWQKKYQELIPYGQPFRVRRTKKLEYY